MSSKADEWTSSHKCDLSARTDIFFFIHRRCWPYNNVSYRVMRCDGQLQHRITRVQQYYRCTYTWSVLRYDMKSVIVSRAHRVNRPSPEAVSASKSESTRRRRSVRTRAPNVYTCAGRPARCRRGYRLPLRIYRTRRASRRVRRAHVRVQFFVCVATCYV